MKFNILRILGRYKSLLLLFSVVAITSFYFFSNYQNHQLHFDEYQFIRKTYFFDLFFLKHDLQDDRWYDIEKGGDVTQPKVGIYIYGLALHAAGISDIESHLRQINYNSIRVNDKPWWISLWGKKTNIFPDNLFQSLQLIFIARRTAILFTIFSIAIIYMTATMVVNSFFGITIVSLFLINPLIANEGKYAMTDSMQLFFFYTNLVLCHYWLKAFYANNRNNILLYSVLLGIDAALGAGVKTSGIMIILFQLSFISLVAATQIYFHRSRRHILMSIVIIITIAFGIFYLMHPFIYRNTGHGLWRMYHERVEQYKDNWLDSPSLAIRGYKQAINVIYQRTFSPTGDYINFRFHGIPVDIVLFITGFVLIIKHSIASLRKTKKIASISFLPLWTTTALVSLIFYLSNDWSRYYVPLVSCIIIMQGYAITRGTMYVKEKWKLFIKNLR